MIDGGYDVADYCAIGPEYGNIDDFNKLLTRAKELGLKIIMDLVPNHTSDKHEWFIKSVNREEGYKDYYWWANAKYNENGERIPPNNWVRFKKF